MRTKTIISKFVILSFSIVIISLIILSSNYYDIYSGKKYGKDIINRLEQYRHSHGIYPIKLDSIDLPENQETSEVMFHGYSYIYYFMSDCEFSLSFNKEDGTWTYYSNSNKWYEGDGIDSINVVRNKIYSQYLLESRNNKEKTILHFKVERKERDSVLSCNNIESGSVVYVIKKYENGLFAGKGYALYDSRTKVLKQIGTWTLFTKAGLSFLAFYGSGTTNKPVIDYLQSKINL